VWKAAKPMQGEEAREEEDEDGEDEDEEDEDEEDEDEDKDEENEEGEDEDSEDGDDPDLAKLFDEVSLLDSKLTYSHFWLLSGRCHRKCP